jgi:hypothetical protein
LDAGDRPEGCSWDQEYLELNLQDVLTFLC